MAGRKKAKPETDPAIDKKSIVNQALHGISNGETLRQVSERLGMSMGTLYMWIMQYDGDKYQDIRNKLADAMAGDMIDAACADEPNVARVKANVSQFILERRFPKQYGRTDKVEITTNDITNRLSAGRKRMSGVIDAEVVDSGE